jgi:hypothetical protein
VAGHTQAPAVIMEAAANLLCVTIIRRGVQSGFDQVLTAVRAAISYTPGLPSKSPCWVAITNILQLPIEYRRMGPSGSFESRMAIPPLFEDISTQSPLPILRLVFLQSSALLLAVSWDIAVIHLIPLPLYPQYCGYLMRPFRDRNYEAVNYIGPLGYLA